MTKIQALCLYIVLYGVYIASIVFVFTQINSFTVSMILGCVICFVFTCVIDFIRRKTKNE